MSLVQVNGTTSYYEMRVQGPPFRSERKADHTKVGLCCTLAVGTPTAELERMYVGGARLQVRWGWTLAGDRQGPLPVGNQGCPARVMPLAGGKGPKPGSSPAWRPWRYVVDESG